MSSNELGVSYEHLEENELHEYTLMLMQWILRIRNHMQAEHEKLEINEIEMEIAIRPTIPFLHNEPNRINDLGYPLYFKIKQMITDAVRNQDKVRQQKGITELFYEKREYTDFFYMDGSVRQRVWENETNHLPEWVRKNKVDLILPMEWNLLSNVSRTETTAANQLSEEGKQQQKQQSSIPIEKQISSKVLVKYEKKVSPLPLSFEPIYARRKVTHKCRFPEHSCCWIDLSEVQNIKFSNEGKQSSDDGPPSYEIEIELSNKLLTANEVNTSSKKQMFKYKNTIIVNKSLWIDCATVISLLFGLVNKSLDSKTVLLQKGDNDSENEDI